MDEIKEKNSLATKRNNLFKKYAGLISAYKETANFEEPALILLRRTKNSEFYEKATQGTFTYTHTNGETRDIILHPSKLHTMPYGKKTIRYYICHEDFPLPLPEDPVITAETVGIAIDKTLNDVKKWKTSEMNAKSKMIMYIIIGIIGIILAIAFFRMLVPSTPQVTQIIETIQRNITTPNVAILG